MSEPNFLQWSDGAVLSADLKLLSQLDTYRWLKPFVGEPLAKTLFDYLEEKRPIADRFPPLDIETNIVEASALLTRCLDRRSEVMDLQATAIEFALDSRMAEGMFDHDEEFYRMQLSALMVQKGEPLDLTVVNDLVESRFRNVRGAHTARVNLHNTPNSPLNYGERATKAKRLLCESVRSLIERLSVIEVGAKSVYGIDIRPLPSITAIANDLDEAMWWLRDIVRAVEDVERHEQIHTVSFRIFRDLITVGSLQDAQTKFQEHGVIEFTVTNEAAKAAGINVPLEKCRVVGVSAFIAGRSPVAFQQEEYLNSQNAPVTNYDAKRTNVEAANDHALQRTLSYSCTVQAPDQRFGGDLVSLAPVDLGYVPLCFEALPHEDWKGAEPQTLLNASPDGMWRISVGNQPILHHKWAANRKIGRASCRERV